MAQLYKMKMVGKAARYHPWKEVPDSAMKLATIDDFVNQNRQPKIGMEFWVYVPFTNHYNACELNKHMTSTGIKTMIKHNLIYLLK